MFEKIASRRTFDHRLQTQNKLILLVIFCFIEGWFLSTGWVAEVRAQERVQENIQEPIIEEIKVRGNKKIDTFAILAKILSKEGSPLEQEQLRADLKAIYQMGFFEDVMISTEDLREGVRVIFTVEEKAFLIDIQLAGNQELETRDLEEKISLKTQTFVDHQQIKENAERLRRHYEEAGYFEARVLPLLRTVEEDRVTLTFYIHEGSQARIRQIRFEGRRALPEALLKKEIKARRSFWLTSWLTGSGIYKKEVVEQDVERIKDLYLNHGFLQVQVGSPGVDLSPDKRWFEITFPIIEGDPFTIHGIRFSGNTLFGDEELRSFLKFGEGEILRRGLLHESSRDITDVYGKEGYIFAQVIPRLDPDPATRTVAVTLEIQEKGQVNVRRIRILGNDKTRDKVIRREIRVNEREVINTQALRRSFQGEADRHIQRRRRFQLSGRAGGPGGDDPGQSLRKGAAAAGKA